MRRRSGSILEQSKWKDRRRRNALVAAGVALALVALLISLAVDFGSAFHFQAQGAAAAVFALASQAFAHNYLTVTSTKDGVNPNVKTAAASTVSCGLAAFPTVSGMESNILEIHKKRERQPGSRSGVLVAWLVGVAVVGFVILLVYSLIALGGLTQRCPNIPGWYAGGGQVSGGSLLTAAVVGGSLWLAAGFAAWRLRRKLGLLFGGFVAVYVIGLVVLWLVSPLLWGPRHCQGNKSAD